ncbi:MAG: EscU/YscU/HrcU family type III secretion system export apparatus switch protein [Deltaproteobacteria bacterium]|nr:EscU/YscU/HrcU family type III secretion system export apparatus switch protein [Deltaproteobacteria bacterium]
MSAEHDNRTEQATPKQRGKFVEEGKIWVSREVISMAVLVAAAATFALTVGGGSRALVEAFQKILGHLDEHSLESPGGWAGALLKAAALLVLPVGAAAVLAALIAGFAQTKGYFNFTSVLPKGERLNPLPRLQGLFFSKQALLTLLSSAGKVLVIGALTAQLFLRELEAIVEAGRLGVAEILAQLGGAVGRLSLRAIPILIVFAVIDWILGHRRMEEAMKMTKEDVRQEHKEQEGDPHIKGKRRAKQRELAKNRMMAQVPKADVVLVNPTHFAVALRYDAARMGAPRVTAKGADEVAARIRDLARKSHVPVIHNPPLARALHAQVAVNAEIPAALYGTVAEVLAFVYRLRGRAA